MFAKIFSYIRYMRGFYVALTICFFACVSLSIAQNLHQDTLQKPLQNASKNHLPQNSPLHQNLPQNSLQPQNPFRDSSNIDSNLLQSYSNFTHRYNTRFDKQHNLGFSAFVGQIHTSQKADFSSPITTSNYAGATISYDGLIERYNVGAYASYVFNDKAYNIKAHTAILGAYTDFFLDSHHIQARFAQSFNFLDLPNFNIVSSSATNFNASYGYVFSLGSKGSFIEPFSKFSIASLFSIEKSRLSIPSYSLHSHLELGVHFRQFLGNDKVYFYIVPRFRQAIGVENYDPFLRIIDVSENSEAEVIFDDGIYRSYGLLLVGVDFRISPSVKFFCKANAKITQNLYSYGGTLGLDIAF